MFDTETNYAARRFIDGLPPMLEPRSRDPACAGLRQAASPFLEVKRAKLSPAAWRGFCLLWLRAVQPTVVLCLWVYRLAALRSGATAFAKDIPAGKPTLRRMPRRN